MILTPDKENISMLAARIRDGGIVIAPAGTVFGIIALAGRVDIEEKIYGLKGRDPAKKLLVNMLELPNLPPVEARLAKAFWPGNLTIIVEGVGYRVPADPVLRQILELVDRPLISTSCNISGASDIVTAADAAATFPNIPVIDAIGPLSGTPSTIVEVTDGVPEVLRRGEITAADIAAVLRRTDNV